MQIKSTLGKLTLRNPLSDLIHEQMRNQLFLLSIRAEHIFKLNDLGQHHKDPFDRLLIAHALEEGLTVVTKDGSFTKYGVEVIWD